MTGRPRSRPTVEDGPAPAPLHQFWWLHDARWYQGVLKRFGQQAANEINAEAIRFVARRVAIWCAHHYGIRLGDLPLAEFLPLFTAIQRTMCPAGMIVAEHTVLSENEWETVVTENFALRMLRSAGSLAGYECPCLQMRAGWYAGVGISARDTRVECELSGGRVCRIRTVVERGTPVAEPAAARSDADTATGSAGAAR